MLEIAAVSESPTAANPYAKLGSAILKSAINDYRECTGQAHEEASALLYPTGELGRQHLNWLFELVGCDPIAWRKRLDAMRTA